MTPTVLEAINRQIAASLPRRSRISPWRPGASTTSSWAPARWLRLQSAEEHGHAHEAVQLRARAQPSGEAARRSTQPKSDFASVVEVFERALAQEQEVSRQIDALYELAFHEKVFAAMAELQWFITEQVEEEKTVREIVAKFQMVKNDPASLLDLDRELGGRQRRRRTSRLSATD